MLRLISTRTLRVCSLTAPVVNSRCLSVSANSMTMSRTYEPTVLHNSDENKDALGWAKQIFELREKGIFDEWNKLKDAPAEPLLLVCRTRAYNRLPHYEKEVLSHFGLGRRRKTFEWTVVKNVASNNELLAKVAYLIKVIPLRFPDGIPDNAKDFAKMTLKVTGEFVQRKSLSHHQQLSFADVHVPKDCGSVALGTDPQTAENIKALTNAASRQLTRSEANEETRFAVGDPRRLAFSHKQLKMHHNKRYNHGQLYSEYFASQYRYEHNQDGGEYRYAGLWRHDRAEKQAERVGRNPDGTFKPGNRFEPNYSAFPFRR